MSDSPARSSTAPDFAQRETGLTSDSRFGISIAVRQGTPILRVLGEVDLATAPALGEALTKLAKTKPAVVVVDLSWVSLFDAAGLRVLATANRRVKHSGRELRVVATEPVVRRVFEVTGFDQQMNLFETVEDALPPLTSILEARHLAV